MFGSDRVGQVRQLRPRGVALVTTVLLAVVGATIAIFSIWVAVARVQAASGERAYATAEAALMTMLSEYEAHLVDNPFYFLDHVDRYERARVCVGTSPNRTIQPGQPWDPKCGAVWFYVDPQGSNLPDRPVPGRIEVIPPSTNHPYLIVTALAGSSDLQLGRQRVYSMDSAAALTVYSEQDLRLDQVVAKDDSVVFRGDIYTAGRMFMPTENQVDFKEGLIQAQEGFLPSDGITSSVLNRWFSGTGASGAVEDLSLLRDAPLLVDSLLDDIARIPQVACGPTNPQYPSALRSARLSIHMCLRPGETLVDTEGVTKSIPADAKDFLLIPRVEGAGGPDPHQVIDVYATSRPKDFVQDCIVRCSLPVLAAPEAAEGTHMGVIDYWTDTSAGSVFVGTFYPPASGVIHVAGDTAIALCGRFTDASLACFGKDDPQNWRAEILSSLTILAGTLQSPKDIYLSGPIELFDDPALPIPPGRLGLIATGRVLLPYWSRPPEGDLRIDASLLALGRGRRYTTAPTRGAFQSLPARVHVGYQGDESNQGGRLVITGSLASDAVDLSTNLFEQISVATDPRLISEPPPFFPSFTSNWRVNSTTELTPLDICGQLTCPSWG